MSNKHFLLLISGVIGVMLLLGVAGCKTAKSVEQRRNEQTAKLSAIKAKCDADKDLVSVPPLWASKNWPPIIRYLPGKPVTTETKETKPGQPTTQKINIDSAYQAGVKSVTIQCPPCDTVTIYKLTAIHDSSFQEDVAMIAALNIRVDSFKRAYSDSVGAKQQLVYQQHDKYVASEAKASKRTRWAVYTWIIIALYFGIKWGYSFIKNQYVKKAASVVKDLV